MFTDSPLISRIWRTLTGRTRYAHTRAEHEQLVDRTSYRRRSLAAHLNRTE